MPELPEVEVVRVGLDGAVVGAAVSAVDVLDERSLCRFDGPAEEFIEQLTGRRLGHPHRRGKFLWLPLDDVPLALVGHLGMSGQLLLRRIDDPLPRHLRVSLHLDTVSRGAMRLDFVDQRVFGSLALDELVPASDARERSDPLIPRAVVHIARDPLDPLFDDDAFVAALRRKRTGIKRALLDQTLVSGVGNIYADEALWAVKLHYDRPAESLSRTTANELLAVLRAVFAKALVEGGTSFDDQYLNVNGQAGSFVHSLNAYGRQGEPCPRCGGPIVRESFMNRGSHFCPRCQRPI